MDFMMYLRSNIHPEHFAYVLHGGPLRTLAGWKVKRSCFLQSEDGD